MRRKKQLLNERKDEKVSYQLKYIPVWEKALQLNNRVSRSKKRPIPKFDRYSFQNIALLKICFLQIARQLTFERANFQEKRIVQARIHELEE